MRSVTHPVFGTPVPSDWETLRVDDIRSPEPSSCVAGPFGSNISSRYFTDEGVPVIRGGNLTDDLTPFVSDGFVFVSAERAQTYRAQHVRAGDLVFTCWGTIGQVGRIPEEGPFPEYIISNKQLKLRPDADRTDSRFLYYYFANPHMVEHIRGRAVGSAVPGINLGILKGLPVVLPPLPAQRKIAGVLSAYDDLIQTNQRQIKILEEMAQRIYREWFVDFRYPGHSDVSPVDSELGLPPGWQACPLSGLATVTMGQSPPSAAYNRDGVGLPFHQGVGTYGAHFPTHAVYSTEGARIAEDGDTLVSVRAPVGRINVADRRMILGRGLCGVRAGVAPATFLLQALKEVFREEDIMGGGTIFKSVTRRDMEDLRIRWPGEALAREFADIADPIWSNIRVCTLAIDNLRAARDVLLPQLISGAVDVADLNIAVPEAA